MEVLNEAQTVATPVAKRSLGSRIKRTFFGWFFVLLILGIAFWILAGTLFVVDSKFRSGNVIKFGKDGLLLKTYEGTLRMGGGEGMMNIGGNEFNFSVTDKAMIETIEKVDSRKTVKLWYDKTMLSLPWRGNTEYYIVKMEVMPDIYPATPQIPVPANTNNQPQTNPQQNVAPQTNPQPTN